MPTLAEQQLTIQNLRRIRDAADDLLYQTKLKLERAVASLSSLLKKEQTPARNSAIDRLNKEIARLEADVRGGQPSLDRLASLREKIRETEHRITFLRNKVLVTKARISDNERSARELRSDAKPDPARRDALQQDAHRLAELLDELNGDLEKTVDTHARMQGDLRRASDEAHPVVTRIQKLQDNILATRKELAGLVHGSAGNPDQWQKQVQQLKDEVQRLGIERATAQDQLNNSIAGIYNDPHPRGAVAGLDDAIPFLLLPVRIETRFMPGDKGSELWVRLYPDDIAVHTHEKLLTDEEVAEGKKYWKHLFTAIKTGGPDTEIEKKAAWKALAGLFGPQRAAWIAIETKPTNWSNDLGGISGADDLVFPPFDQTKSNAWSRAPRTKVLPDKFVVQLYSGNTLVHEEVGPVIPDELILGPDPMDAEGSFDQQGGNLTFGESFNWTSDFSKAVKVGMGFAVPISQEEAVSGFDRILVLGLRLSANGSDSAEMLGQLLENHHYSPKGLSLAPQGMATNNTASDKSGYTSNDPFEEVSYVVEAGDPAFTESDDCDGRNLADALGIPYATLQHVLHADGTDYRHAVLMNQVLYPATMGFFVESLLNPVLADNDADTLRNFTINHVAGRGPLPAIRVGNQPYGILLTSNFGTWQWSDQEPQWGTPFLRMLSAVLKHYQDLWDTLVSGLPFVGKGGSDPSEVLMNIMGLQAGSVSFAQRIGYSTDYLKNLDDFQYGKRYGDEITRSFNQKNELLIFLNSMGYSLTDPSGALRVPQALRLVYQHYVTSLDAANLIDNIPLSEDVLIRPYDVSTSKNYLDWLSEVASIDALEAQNFGEGKTAPNALLYLMARRAFLLQLHKASVLWFGNHGLPLNQTLLPTNFYNIRPAGDLTKYEIMRGPLGTVLPGDPLRDMPVSEYLLTAGMAENEAAVLGSMRAALKALAKVPTAKLERCFTEHLDLCTYRLDAWQTGLFRIRLLKQRNLLNADGRHERQMGIYLGAYGWVENVRPSPRQTVQPEAIPEQLRPENNAPLYEYLDNGGFVHAPSLNHASAAAVLRGGYLAHAKTATPDLMAVNLSSERVRRALFILEGIRNGQPLEALLGYQFERGLHDRGSAQDSLKRLNLYIYDFRDHFPFLQHTVQQQGSSSVVTESIPVSHVVNGVTLAESKDPFPYGATGDVTGATPDERAAIEQEKDSLTDTLDAVKDLLLAESTYQMVQGNMDRSGAVLNALKDATAPPEIDVINTPRSSHMTFTNRVTLHFPPTNPDLPVANPWSPIPMSPRAKLEAGLNKWLGTVLGPPDTMTFRVSHLDPDGNAAGTTDMNVESLGLQPIDLVYITGNELSTGTPGGQSEARTGASELEMRIAYQYRQEQTLDDAVTVRIEFMKPDVSPARPLGILLPLLKTLKSAIIDARHIHAEDFDPPSKESLADKTNPKGYDVPEIQSRIDSCIQSFTSLMTELGVIPINAIVKDTHGVSHMYVDLGTTFAAMDASGVTFDDVTYTFSATDAAHVQSVAGRLATFGLPDSFPLRLSVFTDADRRAILDKARTIARRGGAAMISATELFGEALATADVDKKIGGFIAAGKALLGDSFNVLPRFTYHNGGDIQQSNADRTQLLKFATETLTMAFPADEWLHGVSRVRPKAGRWDYIRMLADALSSADLEIRPVQLPYRSMDSWLAVEFPEMDPLTNTPFTIKHDTLSIVAYGASAFDVGISQSGLLIDDWTEVVPTRNEITGITFNFNRPSSAPPQALLLAVTPQEKGHWVWDDLVGILLDTFDRAKRRAVEPRALGTLKQPEVNTLLPAIVSDFTQYDLNVSLDYRLNVKFFDDRIPTIPVTKTLD